jgi:hypothetical protein
MAEIYTPSNAAAEILGERQRNNNLVEQLNEYLGEQLPADCFAVGKMPGFLARYVPRATGEDKIFINEALNDGFTPSWASYLDDRFTNRNPEKVETIRPPIRWQKGQKTRSWIVNPDGRAGKIGRLETMFGYSSADYQQAVRKLVFTQDGTSDFTENTFDMSEWYRLQASRFGYNGEGNLAPFYYPALLALTTVYGALYEDFDGGPNAGNGDLSAFMDAVVYPAYEKVSSDLGVNPIVVRMPYEPGMNEIDLTFLDNDQSSVFKSLGSRAASSVSINI